MEKLPFCFLQDRYPNSLKISYKTILYLMNKQFLLPNHVQFQLGRKRMYDDCDLTPIYFFIQIMGGGYNLRRENDRMGDGGEMVFQYYPFSTWREKKENKISDRYILKGTFLPTPIDLYEPLSIRLSTICWRTRNSKP